MTSIARHVALASAVLLPLFCCRAVAQSVQALAAAAPVAVPVSLDVPRASFASSFEEKLVENTSSIPYGTVVADPHTKAVVVHYDAAVVDSHAKTAKKARELEVLPGVRNASALTCVGVVVVSCHSAELQRRLVDELTSDPHVESARHTDGEMGHCSTPEFEEEIGQFAKNLQLVSAQVATGNSTEDSMHVESFVQGSVTVSGLDVQVANGMLQAWQHLLAASLPNATEGSIEILRVLPWPVVGHVGSRSKTIKEKQRSLRSRSTKVEYKIVAPQGASPTFLDDIEAQLRLLHKGGRSTERFDAALDAELAGLQVVLPDWAKSRFALPRRGAGHELEPLNMSDEDSIACLVAFMLLFFVLAPVLGISVMLCLFNSPLGYWDNWA